MVRQMKTALIDEQSRQKIIEYYQLGVSHKILTQLFCVAKETISYHISKARQTGEAIQRHPRSSSFKTLISAYRRFLARKQKDDYDKKLERVLYEVLAEKVAFPLEMLQIILDAPPLEDISGYSLLLEAVLGSSSIRVEEIIHAEIDWLVREGPSKLLESPIRLSQSLQATIFSKLKSGVWTPCISRLDEEKIDQQLKALGALTEREEQIIRLRFGLGQQAQTLDEIANRSHVTKERIRQLEVKALGKLRRPKYAKHFQEIVSKHLWERYVEAMDAKAQLQAMTNIIESIPSVHDDILDQRIDNLEISVRLYNCLKNLPAETIREVVVKTESELLKSRNFGRKSLNELKEFLACSGLRLGMKFDESGRVMRD